MSAIWGVLGGLFTFRDNFLSAEYQRKLATAHLIEGWRWEDWVLGILAIGLIAALEGSYRFSDACLQSQGADHARVTAAHVQKIADLEDEKYSLERQLQTPCIVPELLECSLEEVLRPKEGLLIPPLGFIEPEDTIVRFTLRLNNQNPAPSTIRQYELVLQPGAFERRILTIPSQSELTEPIGFACPRTVAPGFIVDHSSVRTLEGMEYVVAVTDGAGNVRMTPLRRLSRGRISTL